jgi:hypothetical protein
MQSKREVKGKTVKQFRVKQRLDVVFTVQAETEQEAAALLRKQIEGIVALEAFNAESHVKRVIEVENGK